MGGDVTTFDSTATFTNLLSDSYTINVVDSNGCTDTQSSILLKKILALLLM